MPQLAEASGYAVRVSFPGLYVSEIDKRRENVRDLLLDRVERLVAERFQEEEFDSVLKVMNDVLDPFFDELLDCSRNQKHWLREIFEPVLGPENPGLAIPTNVTGIRRKPI